MAKYYGRVQGSRGEASRTGDKGMTAIIRKDDGGGGFRGFIRIEAEEKPFGGGEPSVFIEIETQSSPAENRKGAVFFGTWEELVDAIETASEAKNARTASD